MTLPLVAAGDDPNFRGRGNRSSGDFFTAAPNVDHSQDFVKRDLQGVWCSCWCSGLGVEGGERGLTLAAARRPPGCVAGRGPHGGEGSREAPSPSAAEWLTWMRTCIGFDGWRLDYVRGFAGSHVKDYMEASRPQFAVGECAARTPAGLHTSEPTSAAPAS